MVSDNRPTRFQNINYNYTIVEKLSTSNVFKKDQKPWRMSQCRLLEGCLMVICNM